MSHDIEQHPPAPAPTRRTVLTGAAWSVPVIAAASLAPLAAASGTPVLAFNQASYGGTACGTITGASVSVTTNGTATSNVSVTTTLSGGYTFAGGSASYTGVSDGSGTVALPSITVPAFGGTSAMAATTGASSASATLTAPALGAARRYNAGSNSSGTYTGVPAGSTPVGAQGFLTPTGVLYYGATFVASGVSKATGYIDPGGGYILEYTSGNAYRYNAGTNSSGKYKDIPVGSTPVGAQGFLTPAGVLYWGNDTIVASGVSKATGYIDPGGGYILEYTSGNAYRYNAGTNSSGTYKDIPVGSTPVGAQGFLTPAGVLYWGNDTIVASGVSKATGYIDPGGGYILEYTSAGAC